MHKALYPSKVNDFPPLVWSRGPWLPDCYSHIFRSYVFGPSGFWTMAPLRYAAKFDPFLSLDCAPTPSTPAQSKERKGSNFAIWQPCGASLRKKRNEGWQLFSHAANEGPSIKAHLISSLFPLPNSHQSELTLSFDVTGPSRAGPSP